MKSQIERLIDAGGLPSECFEGAQAREMRGAVVYVWARGDEVLYIGYGHSLARPLGARHERLWAMQPDDRLLVYYRKNPQEAERFEQRLIGRVHPRFNFLPAMREPDQFSCDPEILALAVDRARHRRRELLYALDEQERIIKNVGDRLASILPSSPVAPSPSPECDSPSQHAQP